MAQPSKTPTPNNMTAQGTGETDNQTSAETAGGNHSTAGGTTSEVPGTPVGGTSTAVSTAGGGSSVSTGTYVGIAIAVVVAIAVCTILAATLHKRRSERQQRQTPRRGSIAAFQQRQQQVQRTVNVLYQSSGGSAGVDLIPNVLYQSSGGASGVDLIPNVLYSSADHANGVQLTPNVLYSSADNTDNTDGYLAVSTAAPGGGGGGDRLRMSFAVADAPQYETADSIDDAASETYAIVETQLPGVRSRACDLYPPCVVQLCLAALDCAIGPFLLSLCNGAYCPVLCIRAVLPFIVQWGLVERYCALRPWRKSNDDVCVCTCGCSGPVHKREQSIK